jgi:hypothetical protein
MGILGGFLVFLPLLLFLVFRNFFMIELDPEYRFALEAKPLVENARFFRSKEANWASLPASLSREPSEEVVYPSLQSSHPLYGMLVFPPEDSRSTAEERPPEEGVEEVAGERRFAFVLDRAGSQDSTATLYDLLILDTDGDGDLTEENALKIQSTQPMKPHGEVSSEKIVIFSQVSLSVAESFPSETLGEGDSAEDATPRLTVSPGIPRQRNLVPWLVDDAALEKFSTDSKEEASNEPPEETPIPVLRFSDAEFRKGDWAYQPDSEEKKVGIALFPSPETGRYNDPGSLMSFERQGEMRVVKNAACDRFVSSTKTLIEEFMVKRNQLEAIPEADGRKMTIRLGYRGPTGSLAVANHPRNGKPMALEIRLGNPARLDRVDLASGQEDSVELPVGDYTPVQMEIECGNSYGAGMNLDRRLPWKVRSGKETLIEVGTVPTVGFRYFPETSVSGEDRTFFGYLEDPELNLRYLSFKKDGRSVVPRLKIVRPDGVTVVNTKLEYG